MSEIEDIKELLKPLWEKIQQLHRDEYTHKISKNVFEKRIEPLQDEKNGLNKRMSKLLTKEYKKRDKVQQKKEEKVVADAKEFSRQRRELKKYKEEQTAKVKVNATPKKKHKQKATKKPKQEETKSKSYKSLIIKALKHEKVNSEEKLLYVVNKWKPGKDKEDLKRQVRNIVSIIKKSKEYTFNNKKYQVKKK